MKEIIKLAIKRYMIALASILISISIVATIHANAIFDVLKYAFLVFIISEVFIFVINKISKFKFNNKI